MGRFASPIYWARSVKSWIFLKAQDVPPDPVPGHGQFGVPDDSPVAVAADAIIAAAKEQALSTTAVHFREHEGLCNGLWHTMDTAFGPLHREHGLATPKCCLESCISRRQFLSLHSKQLSSRRLVYRPHSRLTANKTMIKPHRMTRDRRARVWMTQKSQNLTATSTSKRRWKDSTPSSSRFFIRS